jgi:hypothetical protein
VSYMPPELCEIGRTYRYWFGTKQEVGELTSIQINDTAFMPGLKLSFVTLNNPRIHRFNLPVTAIIEEL